MQKLPARLDWNLSCEILCNSTQQRMRNSPATKGTKYLSREDKRLRHRASCHSEAEREGNAMSLDRPERREPKIPFLWICFSRAVCDVVKLGRVRSVVRACDEQTVLSKSLRLQPSKCTELQAGSPSVTTAAA